MDESCPFLEVRIRDESVGTFSIMREAFNLSPRGCKHKL